MKPSVRKVRFGQKAAHVRFDGGDWDGVYHVITHGRTEIEIAADIDKIQLHHDKKSARLTGFGSITGTTVRVTGKPFVVTDCTLRDRGTDVELYVSAQDGDGNRPASLPMRRIYGSVDDVPANAEIVNMLTNAIAAELVTKADESSKIGRLKQQFGDDTP